MNIKFKDASDFLANGERTKGGKQSQHVTHTTTSNCLNTNITKWYHTHIQMDFFKPTCVPYLTLHIYAFLYR